MKATQILRTLSLIAAASALVAGCSSASGSTATPDAQALTNVTVETIPAVDLAGMYIAQTDGFFTQEGLHVTIKSISSSSAVIASQLAGKVDISAGAYVGYISAEAAGAKFRILAEADMLQPNVRAVVSANNSPITNLAQLEGKKVGVNGTNSVGTLLISMLLAEQGVSPKSVDFVTDPKGFPDMPVHCSRRLGCGISGRAVHHLGRGAIRRPVGGRPGSGRCGELPHRRVRRHPVVDGAAPEGRGRVRAGPGEGTGRRQQLLARGPGRRGEVRQSARPGERGDGAARIPAVGNPDEAAIQGVAQAMVQYGILGGKYSTEIDNGSLVQAMFRPAY